MSRPISMVINEEKPDDGGRELTGNSVFLDNVFSRAIGLMFHRRIDDTGYIFVLPEERFFPLHMWFVFFPIDVLYLDSGLKVVEVKENLKPFRWYFPRHQARYVIELPVGTVAKNEVAVGAAISF